MPDVPDFCFPFLQTTTTTLRKSSCVRKDPEERFGENPQPQFWYSHSTVHFFFIFPKFLPQFEVLKEGFQHERGPVAQISPNLAGRPSVIDEPVDFSHFAPPAPLLPLWLPPKLLPYANYSPLLLNGRLKSDLMELISALLTQSWQCFMTRFSNIITWINWVFLNW